LHPFPKMVLHCSLIQLYVSTAFLLAPNIGSGYMQPDTKLICPIGAIVILCGLGKFISLGSKKWHTVSLF
jgi:hypothetical protein